MSPSSRIVVIAGPTAAGKTELALALAGPMNAEIVSVDSRQLYRHLEIGTAKPSPDDRERVPHHLLDLIEPAETYSAGRFARAARSVIEGLHRDGKTALLVGGSGMYLAGLVDGLFHGPAVDRAVRDRLSGRLEAEGLPALYEELGRLDPGARAGLSPNDEVRILRALEQAMDGCGSRAERWDTQADFGLDHMPPMVCIAPCREELYRRIDERAAAMLEGGWIEEVEALLDRGVSRDAPGLDSLGYSEVVSHVLDGVPRAQTLAAIQRRTRRFAKRQITWFRRDRRLRWLDLDRWGLRGVGDRILRQLGARDAVDSAT